MKKSLLIFLSIIVLASTFFESCVTIRPRCKKDEVSDTTGRYHVITVPYYRKKANVVGSLFVLAVAGGAAVTAYQNSTTLESQIHLNQGDNNQNYYAGGGLVGGYLVAKLLMAIAGNHKIIDVENYNELPKWVMDYNKRNSTDYVMVKDSLLCNPTTLWVIPSSKENSFVPKNFQDVKNFSNTFPNSSHANQVIFAANKILTKSELKKMEGIYSSNNAITETKIEYVLRSKSESEFYESLNEYPEVETQVEQKYSTLVGTYFYASDFFRRYPTSIYSDSVFRHSYLNCTHQQLDSLLSHFSKVCKKSNPNLLEGQYVYIQQCSTIDEILTAVKKYPLTKFPVSAFDDYNNFENANKIHKSISTFKPSLSNFSAENIIYDLRLKYLTSAIENNKGSGDDMKLLATHITSEEWLRDSSVNGLVEKILMETAVANNEDYFTGKKDSAGAFTGYGTLYTTNKRVLTGFFQHGKLNGKGKMIYDNGDDYYEGNFVENELSGNNCIHKLHGNIFKGNFNHNTLNGKGECLFKNGAYMKGEFAGDKLDGQGERSFEDGSYYSGEFKENKFSGQGKYFWQAKDSTKWFEGNFENGKRNGHGILHLNNETLVTGNWKTDCPDGEMKVTKESKGDSMENFKLSISYNNCEADLNSKHCDDGNCDFDEKAILIKVSSF